jgi:Rhs element Vgr protein
MPASANQPGGVVTFNVKVDGTAISDGIDILSIEVENYVNRIPVARIRLKDGDIATGTFEASSSATFVPGKAVTIEAGYDSNNKVIFQGIITRQNLRAGVTGTSLEVECRDKAVKMTVGRKSSTFSKQKDSDIISSMIASYGLSANVSATGNQWPQQVQCYSTDWDFMVCRAEVNGMTVIVQNGVVTVAKPGSDTTSVATAVLGNDLLTFDAELDSVSQLGNVSASSWDYAQQKVIDQQTTNSGGNAPGNLTSKQLSSVIGLQDYQLQTQASLADAELKTWTEAQMVKSQFSKISGEASFLGNSEVSPGKYMTFQGLGDRFNGDYYLSGVRHKINNGNWITETVMGLPFHWFIQVHDVADQPAAGLLPPARGLFPATVTQINNDPDSQYRILINIPLFDKSGQGLWARLSNFYSTSGAGAFFLPEVNDEVVVGFFNEDPRFPVILGSMYSSTTNQPYSTLSPTEGNPLKAIVSKTGINIQFDDKNKILTLSTPAGNTVTLSDDAKEISLKDENGNSIVMSSDGIAIKSPGNISLNADKNITLNATTGISQQASAGDVSIKGINIKEQADAEYSAQGSATASVQGGATLTLKAAMVMIN